MEHGDIPLTNAYIGRDKDLDALADAFFGSGARVAAVVGKPGVGKSSLVIMFSRRFRESFPGGVFRFNVRGLESPAEMTLRTVPGEPMPPERGIAHDKASFHPIHRSPPITLVIWDMDVYLPPSVVERDIRRVLGHRPGIRLLIAARPPFDTKFSDIRIQLEPLAASELKRLLQQAQSGFDRRTFERLSDLCGDNPLSLSIISDLVQSGAMTVEEVLASLGPFERQGVVSADGRPLSPNSRAYREIITDVSSVNDEMLKTLARNPDLIYEISPRRFEEIIAELLHREGYHVSLTPASRDGGKDIYAAQKNALGEFLFVVECKRYALNRPVGIGVVQRLHGVVQAEKANAGIAVTTSRFSREARRFQEKAGYAISLRDYLEVQAWLRRVAVQ